MDKIWKDVLGYEGLYNVSEDGLFLSKRRGGTKGYSEWNLIKTIEKPDGYCNVILSKNGKHATFRVHRIVALAFIPNPNNLPEVNHKNGVRNDNRVENLEWVTRSENVLHSFAVLNKVNSFKGKKHTDETKQKIREYRLGKSSSGSNHTYITINGIEYKGIRVACKILKINRGNLVSKIKKSVFNFKSNGNYYTIDSIKV